MARSGGGGLMSASKRRGIPLWIGGNPKVSRIESGADSAAEPCLRRVVLIEYCAGSIGGYNPAEITRSFRAPVSNSFIRCPYCRSADECFVLREPMS